MLFYLVTFGGAAAGTGGVDLTGKGGSMDDDESRSDDLDKTYCSCFGGSALSVSLGLPSLASSTVCKRIGSTFSMSEDELLAIYCSFESVAFNFSLPLLSRFFSASIVCLTWWREETR